MTDKSDLMHTQGPWLVGGIPLVFSGRLVRGEYIIGAGGALIAELIESPSKANAARIVECVNACSQFKSPAEGVKRLRDERSELICALDELVHSVVINDSRSATAITNACKLLLSIKSAAK